ncbi:6-carboxytetrahydropterin synthase [Azospirillum brasilense]
MEGLSVLTLENIAVWLWDRLSLALPGLSKVAVWRDGCGQHCIYAP